MKTHFPCLMCEDRRLGCHSECDRYKRAVEENRIPNREKIADNAIRCLKIDQVMKAKKRRGR